MSADRPSGRTAPSSERQRLPGKFLPVVPVTLEEVEPLLHQTAVSGIEPLAATGHHQLVDPRPRELPSRSLAPPNAPQRPAAGLNSDARGFGGDVDLAPVDDVQRTVRPEGAV